MDMGTAARPLKEAANEDFAFLQNQAADRAYAVPVSPEAVHAALDVHEPILAAVQGRKGRGKYQNPLFQFGGAHRTGLGIAGHSFGAGFELPASAGANHRPIGRAS